MHVCGATGAAQRFLRRQGLPNFARLRTMKTITLQLLFAVLIAWLAYSQNAQAVNPPPDGGYPGGNTAEGQAALLSLTTGGFNTAVGFFSLRSDTTGQLNTQALAPGRCLPIWETLTLPLALGRF